MKILVVNKFAPNHPDAGGAEKRLEEVCERLGQQHEIHVLGAANNTTAQETDAYTLHHPPMLDNIFLIYLMLSVALPFYALYLKPDVIYEDISVFPWFAPFTCFWVNSVSIIHNFNGRELLTRKQYVKGSLLWVGDVLTKQMYRSETMIVVSKHMEEALEREGFEDIKLIHNGVDQDLYTVESKATPDRLLYIGRLEYRKGPDLLFDVVDILPSSFDIHVAGANQGGYDIPSRIQYHGYVTEEAKQALLSKATYVLIPSRWEGFGIVALEAAATGTPVIANDVPGLREAVAGNDIGVLADFSNPQEVADLIWKVTRETSRRNASDLRENIGTYTWPHTAQQTNKVLRDETS